MPYTDNIHTAPKWGFTHCSQSLNMYPNIDYVVVYNCGVTNDLTVTF